MTHKKIPELKPLFLERMKKLLPDEKDFGKYLEEIKIQPVNAIRCNKLKITSDKLKKTLEEKYNWKISIPWKAHPEIMIIEGKFDNNKNNSNNTHLVDNKTAGGRRRSGALAGGADSIELEPGELGRSLEHLLGYYYIQELSSMLPVIALTPEKNQRVLDLCAAPGSKTTQISSEMQNTGILIANEPSLPRLKILSSNLERCGAANVLITKRDGRDLCRDLKKINFLADQILVDAPCSGEGTLRSSLKTYLMWNIKSIQNLPKIQEKLFSESFEILKTGGEIIYSTCTHTPEENEEIVNKILEKFGEEIEILDVKKDLPKELKTREGITEWNNQKLNSKVKLCVRIYPQDNNTEGFFIAKFRRKK